MFRYRDKHGFEKRLINEAALLVSIRAGDVLPGTPLAEGVDGPWIVAGRHPAFARAGRRSGGPLAALRALRDGGFAKRRIVVLSLVAGVLLAGAGFTADYLRAQRLAEQRLALAEGLLGFAEGRTPAPELIAMPAPAVDDAVLRTLWVRLQVAHAIDRSIDSTQMRFDIRGFLPPDGWMSDDYVMNPKAYEPIGAHWKAYLSWDRFWSPGAADRLRREEAYWAGEAKLTERQTFELIDPAQPGLRAIGWDLELRREFAAEANRLHTTLVESRGNAFLSDGKLWFADTRTQRAYAEHVANLGRIAGQLLDNANRRAQAYGLTPGDGVVPPAVAHMRPAGS